MLPFLLNCVRSIFIGIGFPGGKSIGDTGNLKLRFDDTYMAMAADGKL